MADSSATPAANCSGMLDEPSRDFWWNEDFVELLARRVRLADAEAVLDVGCGIGHWTPRSRHTCTPAPA